MVMPGDNVEMKCELHRPVALDLQQRFNIREGMKTKLLASELMLNYEL